MLVFSSCCYSSELNTVYGQTPNAAGAGLVWGMQTLLPQQAGLTVGSIIYRYTVTKDTNDYMLVHVQNEDAQGPGYIFRETDDWSYRPGNTINKLVQVGDIPLERWGQGSIEVEGFGTVSDATVIYNYQYEPCFDPQSSPVCPGYIDPFVVEVIDGMEYVKDPLDDELIQAELGRKAEDDEDDEKEEDRERMEKIEKLGGLEVLLGGINSLVLSAEAQARHAELMAMNYIPPTYLSVLDGRVYKEEVEIPDATLPSNSQGKRVGLAQQLLHEEMVQSQYKD